MSKPCPGYTPAIGATRLYMEVDLETKYGEPDGHPVPISFYDSPVPLQIAGNVEQSARAEIYNTANRMRFADISYTIDGSLFLYGGASVSNPPNWMKLLQICGFDRKDRSGVPTYVPSLGKCQSATINTWMDGPYHSASGCRGIVSLIGTAGQAPELKFGISGIYSEQQTKTMPTPHLDSPIVGRVCGIDFVIDVDGIGTIIPVIKSFSLELTGTIRGRTPASVSGRISEVYHDAGRNPTWTCVVEVDKDHQWVKWFTEQRAFKLRMKLPTINKKTIYFTIDEPIAHLMPVPTYAVDRGVRVWQLQFLLGGPNFLRIEHK